MQIEKWIRKALETGFSCAGEINVEKLQPVTAVRDMCAADKCNAYGRNWSCPPACGTLEECEQQMKQYSYGLLLQTVGNMEKTIDTKAYRRTEQSHMEYFRIFAECIKKEYPDALCLGAGGCRICRECAWPESCRFPDKAYSSMEGYGLFVTQVCKENGMQYYHGERTITYTACVLFGKKQPEFLNLSEKKRGETCIR